MWLSLKLPTLFLLFSALIPLVSLVQPQSLHPSLNVSFDGLNCSLVILSSHLSAIHSARIACCGLWALKRILKSQAEYFCTPQQAVHTSFFLEHTLTEDLLYSSFTRSLLKDEGASCAEYPEGSRVCDQLYGGVLFLLFLLFLVPFLLGVMVANLVLTKCCKPTQCHNTLDNAQQMSKEHLSQESENYRLL